MSADVIGDLAIGSSTAESTLTNNLISFWKLEEASGTRVDEVSGYDLTDNNTVAQGTGKIGNAAEFVDANSESLTHVSNSDFQTGDVDWTWAGWVKFNDLASDPGIAGKTGEWGVYFSTGNGRLQAYFTDTSPATNHAFFAGFTINTGVWYLIFVYNDSTANEFVMAVNDEVPQAWSYGGAIPRTTSGDFTIGLEAGLAAYGSLLIDAVGFWKRLLTSDERTELYNGGAGSEHPF